MTKSKRIRPLLMATVLSAAVVSSVLLWNHAIAFQGDIFGFYRIGTVLPHSPYVAPSKGVLAEGEVGYDGQLFLSIALDPSLTNPQTVASLDNPRYRYRRILFPVLGYLLSLGHRYVVPFALVLINSVCLVTLVIVVGRMLEARQQPVWCSLFVLGIPGFWCSLLLTTSDLLAALLLALSLAAYTNARYRVLTLCYGLAALTHETMLVVIGSLAIPLLARRQWRDAVTVLTGCIPALLWNVFVFFHIPSDGSTSGFVENFAFPGAGIVDKLQAALSGPVSAKWLFDTSAFVLLCGTFCFLIFSLRTKWRLYAVVPCVSAYLGFFVLSRMQILSYYLDFLRVYGSVVLLLVVSLQYARWPRVTKAILLAWCALSSAIVAAFSMKMI
jgi:hypothetical protein